MAARCKIKKAFAKGASKEDMDEMNRMFNQMTGAEDADMEIIIPKIVNLKIEMAKLCRVFKILVDMPDVLGNHVADFTKYIESTVEECELTQAQITSPLIDESEAKYYMMTQSDLNVLYNKLKDSQTVKDLLITCSNLHQYEEHIKNRQTMDDGFIFRAPGLEFKPFEFSQLNIKAIFTGEATKTQIKLIMNVLSHVHEIGCHVYEITTSPNIDVKEFSKIMVKAISHLKSQIPRCDAAFNVIQQSIEMLEKNFKTYYRSAVDAKNPSLILQDFISDVALTQSGNLAVVSQLKHIVSFLQKKAESQHSNDPKLKALFDMMSKQFSVLDKHTKKSDATDEAASPEAATTAAETEAAESLNKETQDSIRAGQEAINEAFSSLNLAADDVETDEVPIESDDTEENGDEADASC